jgi:hypothetical protein
MLDIIGQIFWYGILAAPVISFLIIRKYKSITIGTKVFLVVFLTLLFGAVFYVIGLTILFRNGLGFD